ncbi:antibiotic biosynthesis monooxygenase family protein [Methylocystis sp. JAN1]|uniref:antibiotic biosynthesis monooxygenase family protein n=1 Tax=Methylocystis sp. JAN1 TaxID=3397211 RepID=UPI003FA1AEF3
MFMASEQVKVFKGHEAAFERRWAVKQLSFQSAPGYISCRFTRGSQSEDGVVYLSLTVWANEESFLAWKFGLIGRQDWLPVSGPDRTRMEEFDAMVPRSNPQ